MESSKPTATPDNATVKPSAAGATTKGETNPGSEAIAPSTVSLEQAQALADLQEKLSQAQSALEESQAQQGILQRQVSELEADLATQETQVKTLQTQAKEAARLRQELDDAKTMIRRLSEQAPKAVAPAAALTPAPVAAPVATPKVAEPAPKAKADAVSGALRRQIQVSSKTELWRVLEHPVAIEIPSTKFTDDDIGWVD